MDNIDQNQIDDSLKQLIQEIGQDLKKDQKQIDRVLEILAKNWYNSIESLTHLTLEECIILNIPTIIYNLIKSKINTSPSVQQLLQNNKDFEFDPKTLSLSDCCKSKTNQLTSHTLHSTCVHGNWNHVNSCRAITVIGDREFFGVESSQDQIGIGLTILTSNNSGIRFQNETLGFYKDANDTMFCGEGEKFNLKFHKHISKSQDPHKWSPLQKQNGFFFQYLQPENQLLVYYPFFDPVLVQMPEHFQGKQLVPIAQAWNNCSLDIVNTKGKNQQVQQQEEQKNQSQEKESQQQNEKGLEKAKQTAAIIENFELDKSSLVLSNCCQGKGQHIILPDQLICDCKKKNWNHVNSCRLNGEIHDAQEIGIESNSSQVGIGLAIVDSPLGGVRFINQTVGFYKDNPGVLFCGQGDCHNQVIQPVQNNSQKQMSLKYLKSDNCVQVKFPNCSPINFKLREEFRNQSLVPVVQVWNNATLKLVNYKN